MQSQESISLTEIPEEESLGYETIIQVTWQPFEELCPHHYATIIEAGFKSEKYPYNAPADVNLTELEEVALNDPSFVERKLFPNVDFYSGVIYRAIGIPVQMFTVLFAIGRLPGWIAHWREMHLSETKRICRPRQIYTGETEREWTSADNR